MNALTQLAAVSLPGAGFWLMFSDEVGMLPRLTCFIPGDWSHLSNEKILGVLRAAYPQLTVTWCDWAERPRDYTLSDDVLLVKVLGENGSPPRDAPAKHLKSPERRERERRRALDLHASAGDVADYFIEKDRWRDDPGLRGLAKREGFKTAVAAPVETSVEVVAKCCGIHHTRGSYAALELLGATDRTEGFTAIHEERRACSCCKAVLVVETKRLLGDRK